MNKDSLYQCPICGEYIKRGNNRHIHDCVQKYVSLLSNDKKIEIEKLYNQDGYSMIDMSDYFGFPYNLTRSIMLCLGYKMRTVKEATNQRRCREKYANTCIENFGAEHNFCKNSTSRRSWEKRLLDQEGITNVFQRESVKEKIRNTMLAKYGEDGIFENRRKGNYVEYYIDKYGDEQGRLYFAWVQKRKSEVSKKEYFMEKYGDEWKGEWEKHLYKLCQKFKNNYGLNTKCENVLKAHNIEYIREFPLCRNANKSYVYDFKIGNVLLELNGVYWHCSPKKYKPNDLILFPGNMFIRAKDKWKADEEKMRFAEENGYIPLTIWEDEFSEEFLLMKLNDIKNKQNHEVSENQKH